MKLPVPPLKLGFKTELIVTLVSTPLSNPFSKLKKTSYPETTQLGSQTGDETIPRPDSY